VLWLPADQRSVVQELDPELQQTSGDHASIEELQEEVALQEKSHNDTSLLSELENNLDTADWSLDKEQVMH